MTKTNVKCECVLFFILFRKQQGEVRGEKRKRLLSHGNKLLHLTSSSILDASLHPSVCENVQVSCRGAKNEWMAEEKENVMSDIHVVVSQLGSRIFFFSSHFIFMNSLLTSLGWRKWCEQSWDISFLYKIISLGWGKRRKKLVVVLTWCYSSYVVMMCMFMDVLQHSVVATSSSYMWCHARCEWMLITQLVLNLNRLIEKHLTPRYQPHMLYPASSSLSNAIKKPSIVGNTTQFPQMVRMAADHLITLLAWAKMRGSP